MKKEYTYKFRLYPTKKQKELLAKHFGSIRYIYNLFLDKHTKFYLNAKEKQLAKKTLTYVDMAKELTQIKQKPETGWLNECNAQSLQYSLRCVDKAFQNFFRGQSKFPVFKRKGSNDNFHCPDSSKFDINQKEALETFDGKQSEDLTIYNRNKKSKK